MSNFATLKKSSSTLERLTKEIEKANAPAETSKYGKKIFDKITMAMNPEFDGDKPVNPFHFWEGANFKLRIRTVDGYPNYDQSLFDAPKPLSNDDAELERIWNKQHSLQEFVAPSNFKSYDDLKKRLNEVLGLDGDMPHMQATKSNSEAIQRGAMNTTPSAKKVLDTDNDSPPYNTDDEDDEELQAFKNMALG